VENVNIILQLN